ncbi:MAG: hypothetical protein V3V62_03335 [bacterium]
MVTGCAPFFLLVLAGVAFGSWAFGGHTAARLTGLSVLALSLIYFALLNWTAQTQQKRRREGDGKGEREAPKTEEESTLSEEERAEWVIYLRSEGRILWAVVTILLAAILFLILRR